MHREGIREVAVCGNRETRLLNERLERHVPRGLTVSYHQDPMPRGAAGSARDAALTSQADTFVVADATLIPNVNLHDLLSKHHESGACVTVVVQSGGLHHGDSARRAPSGIYVFSRRALDAVPARGFFDIKEELIPRLHAAGEQIIAFDATEDTPRVLDAATYMAANEWMVERLVRSSEERDGYVRTGEALVHRDAFVADDAALIGPVLVEPGARILAKAVVVGPTSIGRDATIESGVVVSRSVIWRRSTIAEGATADRCVVADDAVLNAGTQTFQTVVTAEPESELEIDWNEAQAVLRPKEPVLGLAAKFGRFVFGTSSPRSAAAQ
jgi:NDP-sugar pyrophosphorylase family protein